MEDLFKKGFESAMRSIENHSVEGRKIVAEVRLQQAQNEQKYSQILKN